MGTDLLILTADAMFLLGGYGHGDTNGRQYEVRLFGATCMIRNNPYFDVLNEGIEEVVEVNGDILFTRDPLQDQEKRNEQIQEAIGEGIQMLFLNPVDWERAQPTLDTRRETGVGIISVDTVVKNRDSVISTAETDNYQAGQLCAPDTMKQKDEAKIAIPDDPVQTSITNREQGLLDTIADNHNCQVIYRGATTGEIGMSSYVAADLLRHDISLDVVLGGNGPTTLRALAALQQARREEDVLIYGIDGSPDFKVTLDVGCVTGTSAQSPRSIGRKAAGITYWYLGGELVEKYISMPSTMIIRDNLREFEIDGWQ